MSGMVNYSSRTATIASILLSICLLSCNGAPSGDIVAETFDRLNSIRTAKKEIVLDKLEKLLKKTESAATDKLLIDNFRSFRANWISSGRDVDRVQEYVDNLDRRYIDSYYYFYDILYIDKSGYVFYTVKRESDYGRNIFAGELGETRLAKELEPSSKAIFIDYDFYAPSREAAAFFATPVTNEGKNLGWIVFQYSSNRINTLLSDTSGLGTTGEVYITNEKKVMLTQSRFISDSTILNYKVETNALRKALSAGVGNIISKDYRGVMVYSSFEKFSYAGATWVIVVEIDETEVITGLYLRNKEYLLDEIKKRLSPGVAVKAHEGLFDKDSGKVDINEYGSGGSGETLTTLGVTTCTGVVISDKGKFSYLGHLHPLDEAYYTTVERETLNIYYSLINSPYGGNVADLMGEMTRKILHFEIIPDNLREVNGVIAAVHTVSLSKIVDKLLDMGLFLSQIKVLHDPEMTYANIITEVDTGDTIVQWVNDGTGEKRWGTTNGVATLEEIVKSATGYEKKRRAYLARQ